jgi:hypothetical protein
MRMNVPTNYSPLPGTGRGSYNGMKLISRILGRPTQVKTFSSPLLPCG